MNQRSVNTITAKLPWDTTIGIAILSSSRKVVSDRIFTNGPWPEAAVPALAVSAIRHDAGGASGHACGQFVANGANVTCNFGYG